MPTQRYRRAFVGAVAALGALAFVAGPVSAHVTVSSPDASAGSFGKLVFRVPSESDTASTVRISVTLPEDTPFAFVSTKVKPGWTVRRQTEKLDPPVETGGFTISEAVTRITWQADKGFGIGPGEFDEFELSVGPFPETTEPLSFPVAQTYSDGKVAEWNEPMNADGSEPEHPAPELSLGAGSTSPDDEQGAPPTGEPAVSAPDDSTATTTRVDSSDSTARALGIGGLVLGAVGAIAGAIAIRNTRSSS
jgi:uncharacterized protein YcnI